MDFSPWHQLLLLERVLLLESNAIGLAMQIDTISTVEGMGAFREKASGFLKPGFIPIGCRPVWRGRFPAVKHSTEYTLRPRAFSIAVKWRPLAPIAWGECDEQP